jgi:hypothetical protein
VKCTFTGKTSFSNSGIGDNDLCTAEFFRKIKQDFPDIIIFANVQCGNLYGIISAKLILKFYQQFQPSGA